MKGTAQNEGTNNMRNKYGQKVTAYLEQANGEHADLNRYIRDALKSQDLEAWKCDPKGLADWLAQGVSNYVQNCDTVIVTHTAEPCRDWPAYSATLGQG